MLPRKPAELVAETAPQVGFPEDVVDKVVHFYWKELRRTLVEMKNPVVTVVNLGRFMVRPHMLVHAEQRCQKYLEKNEPLTFHRAAVRKDAEERLEGIRRLQTLCEQEKLRKKDIKLTRNGKISEGGLEEQETHT